MGVLCLKRVDAGCLFHGQTDVIEAIEQAVTLEVVEVEGNRATIGAVNFLGVKVDRQRCVGTARCIVH